MTHQGLSRETLAAQACGRNDSASGALVPPIHPSTIYEANPDGTVLRAGKTMTGNLQGGPDGPACRRRGGDKRPPQRD